MGWQTRSLSLCVGVFVMLAGGVFAFGEDETTTYNGFVSLESGLVVSQSGSTLSMSTTVDVVTNAGEFRKLVVSEPSENFFFSVARLDGADSALLSVNGQSAVHDASVDVDPNGVDQVITIALMESNAQVGEVHVWLDDIVLPGPQPLGGGSPGTDIAVSRVGQNSSGNGDDYAYYGVVGGIRAFSAATTSCNVGTSTAEWISGSSGRHPLIAQNVYRYSNGRYEQIGQSWLKHSFCAVSEPTCGGCQATGCSTLGIGCADTYWATLNGDNDSGPRSNVNPQGIFPGGTGTHSHPHAFPSGPGALQGRIQIADSDIGVPGAEYFIEAHYITHDEPPEARHNNASTRKINLSLTNMSSGVANPIQMFQPAIMEWADLDPNATVVELDVPGEGRFHVGYSATDNGDGTWHYEYAIHNMNSDRSGGGFSVPIGVGNLLTNVDFHDVDYHSGEIYDNTDWSSTVNATSVEWNSPQTFAQNQNTNALRWGTTYNFRFDAPGAPIMSDATLTLFKPGTPSTVTVSVPTPESPVPVPFVRGDVDGDGVFSAVADVVFLLNWGFLPGSPEPPCIETVDTNDDGDFQTIVDATYLLGCAFVPGNPCMGAPYPDCGEDPDPAGSLGCNGTACP